MAVGSTEIVTGFGIVNPHPNRPKIADAGVCGKCGAVVASGFEATHAAWHNTGAWSQQAMTTRDTRSVYSKDASGVPNFP